MCRDKTKEHRGRDERDREKKKQEKKTEESNAIHIFDNDYPKALLIIIMFLVDWYRMPSLLHRLGKRQRTSIEVGHMLMMIFFHSFISLSLSSDGIKRQSK